MKVKNNPGIVTALIKEIPNLLDYYSEEQVIKIMSKESHNESCTADDFMDIVFDTPIRRCSCCGKLMKEGYLLGDEYACSDDCRNALYCPDDKEQATRLYYIDLWNLDEKSVEGMTSEQIWEAHQNDEISDDVFWTSWY